MTQANIRMSSLSLFDETMQRETFLARGDTDLMEEIGTKILKALPSPHFSKRPELREHTVTFKLDWDPLSFLEAQGYSQPSWKALEGVITLTGSVDDAQALTTVGYVSQTWPTTGKQAIRLLTTALQTTAKSSVSLQLDDGAQVTLRMENGNVVVDVKGITPTIIEIGQQLAWLGAALRPSPFQTGVAICSPLINATQQYEGESATGILCTINFELRAPRGAPNKPQGQCWHNMFRNPVIVQGYPILQKQEAYLGLEMPLDMMATLVGSNQITDFNGRAIMKGFSAMLVAMKATGDLLVWHYIFSSDQVYQSYLHDVTVDVDGQDIDLIQLDTARHVVGWCSNLKWNAGAHDAAYHQIDRSGLPPPGSGLLFEKVTISGGKFVTFSTTIALGVKDIPIHVTIDNYALKMKWLHEQYVVLWDEVDKRGWLVNGTSALLHLVRTLLQQSSEDSNFSSVFRFLPEKMRYPGEMNRPETALKVLLSEPNMQLEIWAGKFIHTTETISTEKADGTIEEVKISKKTRRATLFQDIVEERYTFLERMIAYQKNVGGQNGINVKFRPQQYLEGWDFIDTATDSTLRGSVAAVHQAAYGWIQFIRSFGAVTLFGKGFGDIIEPTKVCALWPTVPTGKSYLAASVYDLEVIQKKQGASIQTVQWHSPSPPFATCSCQYSLTNQQGHDLVQVFCSSTSATLAGLLPTRCKDHSKPGKLEPKGAIIFGDHSKWGPLFRHQLQDDSIYGGSPSSAGGLLEVQNISSPSNPESQNQEGGQSSLGWSSRDLGHETEQASISAAPSNRTIPAPFRPADNLAQDIDPEKGITDRSENFALREDAHSPSHNNGTRPTVLDTRKRTYLRRLWGSLHATYRETRDSLRTENHERSTTSSIAMKPDLKRLWEGLRGTGRGGREATES
ncbi:putative Pfs domain protein [Rosellinia necatrix]|uniref:Putative Pfs domain protein n=1 Tax=Rosellinia necatrix TaxID=77044 RepID=A0A1S8A8P0_ROSNE|nr:putative Pfs domain protein [Rosellinia necatrix]